MKRCITTFLILLLIILFNGCNSDGSALSAEQQNAVDASIEFISNSSFTSKDKLDTDIIKIENATDQTWESVCNENKQIEQKSIDLSDWVITIGDTLYHDFAVIVIDSDTKEVIGYIPID